MGVTPPDGPLSALEEGGEASVDLRPAAAAEEVRVAIIAGAYEALFSAMVSWLNGVLSHASGVEASKMPRPSRAAGAGDGRDSFGRSGALFLGVVPSDLA